MVHSSSTYRPASIRSGLLVSGLLLGLICASPPRLAASPPPDREYEIKAAFLYHFVRFTEWPPASIPAQADQVIICLLGTDPFGPLLDALAGKEAGSRTIAVHRVETPDAAHTCHLLFISDSEQPYLRQHLQALSGASVLTVSDAAGFAKTGGIIQLITTKNRVRFAINGEAAHEAGIKISSRIRKLAKQI